MSKKNKTILSIVAVLIVFGIVLTAVATLVESKNKMLPAEETVQSTENAIPVESTAPEQNHSKKIPIKTENEPTEQQTEEAVGNGEFLGTYKVSGTDSGLNLRATPTTEGNQVGKIPEGTSVEVVAIHNDWGFVKYNNDFGWISLEYASLTQKKDEAGKNIGTYKVVTEETPLTIRELPDKNNGTAITSMPKGSSVKVLAIYGEWAFVDYNGTLGWSASQYLEKQ